MLAVRFERAVLTEAREIVVRLDTLGIRQNKIKITLRAIINGTLPVPQPARPEPPYKVPRTELDRIAVRIRELKVRRSRMKELESECWKIVLRLRRLMERATFIQSCNY